MTVLVHVVHKSCW